MKTITRAGRRAQWLGLLVALCCTTWLGVGCESTQSTSPRGASSTVNRTRTVKAGAFAELNLLLVPFGISPQGGIQMEAVALQVYAVKQGKAKGAEIVQGELEVSLYDGARNSLEDPELKLLQTWTYTPAELKALAKESLLGTGYQLLLVWDKDKKPQERKVTVQALYRGADGQELRSEPGVITLGI